MASYCTYILKVSFFTQLYVFKIYVFIYIVKNRYEVKALVSHIRLLQPHGTVAHQAPLSMGFPKQEYWSGLPFPSLEPGIKPRSLHCRQILYCLRHQRSSRIFLGFNSSEIKFLSVCEWCEVLI